MMSDYVCEVSGGRYGGKKKVGREVKYYVRLKAFQMDAPLT
jgi:hypothetical protein